VFSRLLYLLRMPDSGRLRSTSPDLPDHPGLQRVIPFPNFQRIAAQRQSRAQCHPSAIPTQEHVVIHPDECIDCGVCVPECRVDAIKPGHRAGAREMVAAECRLRERLAKPFDQKPPPSDSNDWEGKPDQFQFLLLNPARVTDATRAPPMICSLKSGPFGVRVFRGIFP
jgi:NAD-dependent dihydropyrimidine dehydrogenase PreA subunit